MTQQANSLRTYGAQPVPMQADDPLHRYWMVRRVVFLEALDTLEGIFSQIGIEYMPIKGAHLLCTGLAEKIAVRQMIDIDLLVRESDFDRCIDLLSADPRCVRLAPDPWSFEQPFHLRQGSHLVRFELHRALNRPERFSLDTAALFSRSSARTALCRIMTHEDALAVLVCHTLVHIVDGIRPQVFEEIALLANTEGFVPELFFLYLHKTGIERFAGALLVAAARSGYKTTRLGPVHASRLAVALVTIKTPGRSKGVLSLMFRVFVELFFVRHPFRLALGGLGRAAVAIRSRCNC